MLLGFATLAFLTAKRPAAGFAQSAAAHYDITAKFDNIGDLKVGAPVSMAGVEVGRVARIDLDPQGIQSGRAHAIELEVQPDPDRQ